jgi:hypothetical protein
VEDKRRFARAPFDGSATLQAGDQTLNVVLADLSLRGALLELPPESDARQGLAGVLTLQLEDSDIAITLQCQINHLLKDRAGVEFQRISVDAMQHLRRLVELHLGNGEEHELGFLASRPQS